MNILSPDCLSRALLLCLLAVPSVAAQYRFDNWTTEHGLPQNSVLAVTQTRDGYLWLATYNGLARFDGVRFTVFDKNNTRAMKTSRYWKLFEDPAGALWATSLDGVLRYQNGVFTVYSREHGLPDNGVMDGNVQSSADGVPLITTWKGAAWWRNGRFVPYEFSHHPGGELIHLGRSGMHWLLDQSGLHARGNGQSTDYPLPFEPKEPLKEKLLEARDGALWMAIAGHGVFKVKGGAFHDYTTRLKLKRTDVISNILEDRDGSLWFGTENSGLRHFRDVPGEDAAIYTTAQGLAGNAVRGLWQDREGTLWIGLDGGGLNRMTRQVISGYSEAQGLTGDVVHAVLEDRAGNVWAATQAGLGKIAGGKVAVYLPGNAPRHLPLTGLQALYEDRAGRLWIGSSSGFCSFKDGVFSEPARKVSVWAIREDRQGTLWIGTQTGLLKFRDGVKTSYTTSDGLPSNIVKTIYEDRRGTLWFGLHGGLVKYEEERFTVFSAQAGLDQDRIWSIHEDAEGTLWLGTFDSGLIRFKDGRFTRYTMAQGLYENGTFQILEDDAGNLWMSSYRGLHRVSRRQLNDFAEGKIPSVSGTAYGKAEGMLVSDCNGGRQPSGVKTRDGRLWFTTIKGLAVVNQNELVANPLPPPVLIEGARLDRSAAEVRAGLRVLPGQSNLEIAYTALSFIKAEQIRFKYQLAGQDPDWIEAGTRRTANYSYLRPGRYTFKLIAANSDGVWNNEGAQLQVTVLPAFYQTWWFRLLALLTVAGLIGLIFKRRLDRAYRARQTQEEFAQRLIESQEHERKRIATELHDGLGQSLLVIKNRALMGAAVSNEAPAREQFSEITSTVGDALGEVRTIAYNLRPLHLERLGLTATLEEMLADVAAASGIEIASAIAPLDGLFTPAEEINLYRIVQECLNNIVKHSQAAQASVIVQIQESELRITISDDGRGFDPTARQPSEPRRGGMGLTGLAERVRILGGTYQLLSTPGEGTQIRITIPLAK
ncbi:MAG TPA: two-component regulator propeller domain-containing protein [Blastocatellia bacterium]